jgi:hypothetical protein
MSQKSILEQMYDAIMENGGPSGPISKSVVEAFEETKVYKEKNKKIIIGFRKKLFTKIIKFF